MDLTGQQFLSTFKDGHGLDLDVVNRQQNGTLAAPLR